MYFAVPLGKAFNMKRSIISVFLSLLFTSACLAHPGSGIAVDKDGQIYFTDTGKGIWKLDLNGKLSYIQSSRFHWMTLDGNGSFARSPKSFGEYFEKVTPPAGKPGLIMCSDFPITMGKDGNIYYVNTRPGSGKIIKRTPEGKESTIISDKIFESVSEMTTGPDGSLFITEASNSKANTIRKITLSGKMTVIATYQSKESANLPAGTDPSYCRGLTVDSTGAIYIAATGSRSILRITPQGAISTVVKLTGPWTPTGITIYNGELFLLEWHDVVPALQEERTAWIPRIQKIGKDGKLTTLATVQR